MSDSAAIIGKGTTIGYGANGASPPGSYTAFLEVNKVTIPKTSVAKVKVTHFLSANGRHEYKPGWIDSGTLEFDANYISSDRIQVESMLGTLYWFQLTYPDTHTETCKGFIVDVGGDVPNEDKISTKVTIQFTGTCTSA